MVTCRQCETEINQATEICPHCGADLTELLPNQTPEKPKPSVGKILMRWGILLTILLGAMWSFLWFVVSPRTGHVTLEAETQAVEALETVRGSLASYAQAQSGAYPATLEALGAPVRQAAQMAQGEGYQLIYTPGSQGPDGVIQTYTLEARAGNYGYRNFFTDVSGVIRVTSENRSATSEDPPLR